MRERERIERERPNNNGNDSSVCLLSTACRNAPQQRIFANGVRTRYGRISKKMVYAARAVNNADKNTQYNNRRWCAQRTKNCDSSNNDSVRFHNGCDCSMLPPPPPLPPSQSLSLFVDATNVCLMPFDSLKCDKRQTDKYKIRKK